MGFFELDKDFFFVLLFPEDAKPIGKSEIHPHCQNCDMTYPTFSALEDHNGRVHHHFNKKNVCGKCRNVFKTDAEKKEHKEYKKCPTIEKKI